tara:strand:+ start:1400 stop:1537 length:138 start_codon:yes stop_codon:yes gene_type:complete
MVIGMVTFIELAVIELDGGMYIVLPPEVSAVVLLAYSSIYTIPTS